MDELGIKWRGDWRERDFDQSRIDNEQAAPLLLLVWRSPRSMRHASRAIDRIYVLFSLQFGWELNGHGADIE